jgi:hypothetical protein
MKRFAVRHPDDDDPDGWLDLSAYTPREAAEMGTKNELFKIQELDARYSETTTAELIEITKSFPECATPGRILWENIVTDPEEIAFIESMLAQHRFMDSLFKDETLI